MDKLARLGRAALKLVLKLGKIIVGGGLVVLIVVALVKWFPIDLLRGDKGRWFNTKSLPPETAWRLQVKDTDLRTYEFRLRSNPKFLCVVQGGERGAIGLDCEYDPDYVAPPEISDTPEVSDPTDVPSLTTPQTL